MKIINCPAVTLFNEATSNFIDLPEVTYHFEHSLLSITKWENKYGVPFLSTDEKSVDALLDYVVMMNLDSDFDINRLMPEQVEEILNYIHTYITATTFGPEISDEDSSVMTSEVIYAYLAEARIPFECESWNLNRLLTVLRVISELHKPKEKMTEEETRQMYIDINAKRRAEAEAAEKQK